MAARAKYLGDGTSFFNSIPARDLEPDEFEALTDEQQETVRNSELYRVLDGRIAQNARPTAPQQPKPAAEEPAEPIAEPAAERT